MKVGDLVQINGPHWRLASEPLDPVPLEQEWICLMPKIGIIISDLNGKGNAFKVLISDGKIRSKLRSQLGILSENSGD